MSTLASRHEALLASLRAAGQEHVLAFFDKLSAAQQDALLSQLEQVDIAGLARLFERAQSGFMGDHIPSEYGPPPAVTLATDARAGDWQARALAAMGEGKIGVVLLAGGQGSRLGSSAPKGCYDIGLPSHKSLFQLQAERILRLQFLSRGTIPLYLMTSPQTHAETVRFFEAHAFFGLARENVVFFEQGTLPCLSSGGQLMLESAGLLATAPDGNGGIYGALARHRCIEDMERRGVTHVHVYCVDNCLAKVADPVFMGFSLERNASCAVKVVPKAYAKEAVGVLCSPRTGNTSQMFVVEYSELPESQACALDDSGALLFNAANIANHAFSVAFLRHAAEHLVPSLYHHVARKQIPCIDAFGSPTKQAGIKLELFIFDVLPLADTVHLLQVDRASEFAPLKNGLDAPADNARTAREALHRLHICWAKAAGAQFVDEDAGGLFEIAPTLSYAGEGLSVKLAGCTFSLRVNVHLS